MMGNITAKIPAKRLELLATVTRADGTVEELGRIAYWHKNPLKNWWGQRSVRKG